MTSPTDDRPDRRRPLGHLRVSQHPVTAQAGPAARRALLASWLGWLFDGYETFALILVGAVAIRDLVAPDQLAQLPLYFGGLIAVTLLGWATGGLAFGVLADYLGRRRALMLSILLYAVFTGLSAAAPDYETLVALRFLTGLGLGGEFAPGTTLVAELWPPARRGRAAGALCSAFAFGSLLASGLWLLVGALGPGAWRMMFVIGILPAFFLLWLRRGVEDPAIWVDAARRRRRAREAAATGGRLGDQDRRLTRFTIADLFQTPELRRRTLLLLVMSVASVVGYWGVSSWVPQYAGQVAARAGHAAGQWGALAGLLFSSGAIAGCLALGALADRWGRKPTIALFCAGSVVACVAPFLIDRDLVLFLVAAAANGFFTSGQFAWMAVYLPEVYPTAVRGTGTAVVYNSARYLAAFGPLVAGWVVEFLGGIAHAAALMSSIYLLGLAATPFAAPETKGQPLPD
jgi:MFS family permease